MPYEPVDVVEVRCWGSRVGAVALDPRSGYYAFEYDPTWTTRDVELAPTTMPASGGTSTFVFPTLPIPTFHRLPAMIADALPDDFGNALTTAYLANEGLRPEQITPLDRLAYLGTRGVGALEFHPLRGPRTRKATAIELSELVVAARSALSGDARTEGSLTDAISHLIAVGTSAGGARAKAVVALILSPANCARADPHRPRLRAMAAEAGRRRRGRGAWSLRSLRPHRVRVPPDGRAAGIEMNECRLLEEGGRAHFMTRRFDRLADGGKVHLQTLCALGQLDFRQIGAHDYAQLFLVIDDLGLGPESRAQAFRRMTFNVAAANCDDHTKNVSFALSEGGRWQLAPAYDVTHAHAPESRWTRQHLMAVNGATTGITRADVEEVGQRFGVPGFRALIGEVLAAIAGWDAFAAGTGVPDATARHVGGHIEAWSAPLR